MKIHACAILTIMWYRDYGIFYLGRHFVGGLLLA